MSGTVPYLKSDVYNVFQTYLKSCYPCFLLLCISETCINNSRVFPKKLYPVVEQFIGFCLHKLKLQFFGILIEIMFIQTWTKSFNLNFLYNEEVNSKTSSFV